MWMQKMFGKQKQGPISIKWKAAGESVRGAKHVSSNTLNQDALRIWPEDGAGPPLILAVADGHGEISHFRSNIGSQLAVDAAIEESLSFIKQLEDNKTTIRELMKDAQNNLPRNIWRNWRDKVSEHIIASPTPQTEYIAVEMEKGIEKKREIALNPIIAYGTTLLIGIITREFLVSVQLGDGAIIFVNEEGEVDSLEKTSSREIGDETNSLCQSDAWRRFNVNFMVLKDSFPALVLLATDGYTKSYPGSEQDFFAVGSDYLEFIRERGLEEVSKQLEGFLNQTTSQGSGDDITLVLACSQN